MSNIIDRVALIGSFKQHYEIVLKAISLFKQTGIEVTTPKGSRILKPDIPFVRFESDSDKWTDEMVQVTTLHRIMNANFVYAVAPKGYVGRTTCYEIGRIIQSKKPIYFSHKPKDLPLYIPVSHIFSVENLCDKIRKGDFIPETLHFQMSNELGRLEQDLLNGNYREI